MDNFSSKKKTSQQSSILEETHFAVCPYLIQIQSDIDYIFTINFQKDCQIIGQLSRLILPASQNSKIYLQPDRNIMFFRVAKDKKTHYKWALYRRNQKGKQQIIQIIKVGLKDIIENYLKFQLDQKESLLKSKTKSQSTHEITKSLKQSKFIKSGVLLHYLFFISANQNKIVEAIKTFKLQQKLSIFQKTFNVIAPRNNPLESKIHNIQPFNSDKRTKEQLNLKLNQAKQQKVISFFDLINKENEKEQVYMQKQQIKKIESSIKNQKPSKTQPLKSKVDILHQDQLQLKKSISQFKKSKNNKIQNDKNKISQVKIRNHIDNGKKQNEVKNVQRQIQQQGGLTIKKLKTKDSFTNLKEEFYHIQQNQQLLKSPNYFKTTQILKTNSPDDHRIAKLNLALTDPSKHIKQSQLSVKNEDISGTSYLRLDDIILNDKRISISDKSSWMHTSKSKTDSKSNQQLKKQHPQIHYLRKEDNCCDELLLNSQNPSQIQQYKKQNKQKNALKRGISIIDKKVYDQINMSHHKPKTLGEQEIRQSINDNMYLKLNSRDDLKLQNKQDKKIDNKYIKIKESLNQYSKHKLKQIQNQQLKLQRIKLNDKYKILHLN